MAIPNYQYEPLTPPSSWTADEKRLLQRITDIFDDIYMKWGRLDSNHLAPSAVKEKNIAPNAVTDSKILSVDAAKVGRLDVVSFEAVRARIQDLAADLITTNTFEAKFADIESADIDYAKIRDLIADEAIITEGVAKRLYIKRLAVTSANIVNATIGRLIMPGADGKYYAIAVGSDGIITTEEVTVTEGEITAGETADGKQIVGTTINAEEINGENIYGVSAIITEIFTEALDADKITAAEAVLTSATIPALYTTAIEAIGNSMTFSANSVIRLLLGAADTVNKWFDFDNERGLIIRKPAWVDEHGVEHPASIYSTQTDEVGYHIRRSDMAEPIGSFARDRLITHGVQMGDIVQRRTSTGGHVWTDA